MGKNPLLVHRLTEMGVLPGCEITIVRASPLGGPWQIITESGQNLALRASEVGALECEMVAYPLSARLSGETSVYQIRELLGGAGYVERMRELGLEPGRRIRCYAERPWQVELLPSGRHLDLRRGEAQRLIVEPCE